MAEHRNDSQQRKNLAAASVTGSVTKSTHQMEHKPIKSLAENDI